MEKAISNSDKCHENNNSQRERHSWEERERIVGLGEQGSLLCEDDLSDKIRRCGGRTF